MIVIKKISTLRSDNGGEYLSNEFKIYLKSKGIHHELTVPHCPEQNGVAERMNRTLMEMARSMMAHAGLPDKYWAEAVEAAAYIRNRTSTSSIKGSKTPYEVWSGKKPNIEHLKVFGCMAYSHVPDSQRQKLDKKAVKLRFVGYCIQSKGYRLLDEKTSRVFIRRDVIFNEQDFGHKSEVLKQDFPETFEADPKVEVEPVVEQEQDAEPAQLRRSERSRQPPVRYGIDEYATPSVQHVALKAYQIAEPQSMEEALTSDLSSEWKQAADSEYKSLMDNQTWDLVELPDGREPIGSKWVFKVKPSSDGKVERFKARLVAKGYAQKYGLQDSKPVSTPADPNVRLRKDDGVSKAVDPVLYQSMVGSLLYAAIATRPDISQAVGTVSKFNSKPSEAHLTAVKRIFRYLKGTADVSLKYMQSESAELIGYSDADYAGDLDDRHSTSGNVFLMCSGAVSWLSKKQSVVTLSTAEAEYVALSTATQEAVWLRKLLESFGETQDKATVVMEDNQGAICIAKNPAEHSRTKHIDIRYHYIREALSENIIELNYCPTQHMIADILTKPLPKGRFEMLCNEMGLEKASSSSA